MELVDFLPAIINILLIKLLGNIYVDRYTHRREFSVSVVKEYRSADGSSLLTNM